MLTEAIKEPKQEKDAEVEELRAENTELRR